MAARDQQKPLSSKDNRDKDYLNKVDKVGVRDDRDKEDKSNGVRRGQSITHDVEGESARSSDERDQRSGRARENDDVNNNGIHDSHQNGSAPNTSARPNRQPSSDQNAAPDIRKNIRP